MISIFEDQKLFMAAGVQTTGVYNEAQKLLYQDLIDEETDEFQSATEIEPLPNQIKEACDILVVVAGWLQSVGVDPQQAWDTVHINNMLKVANPPVKLPNGKIAKSPEAIVGKEMMMTTLEMMSLDV